MTKDELAALITGRQRGREITREESRVAADAGLIVIYGSSDDLVEIDGLVVGEIGAWEGARFAMCKDGLIESECPEGDDCPYFQRAVERGMLFSADYDGTWRFTTKCPVSTFKIFDGAELYCVGLVVDVLDLPESPT